MYQPIIIEREREKERECAKSISKFYISYCFKADMTTEQPSSVVKIIVVNNFNIFETPAPLLCAPGGR